MRGRTEYAQPVDHEPEVELGGDDQRERLREPPRLAASTMLPRIKAPSNPDATAQSTARPVASGLAAKSAQARPARVVVAPETQMRAPRPRSRNPIALTTT